MYSFEVEKFGVIIIQSLKSNELQTGTELREGLLKYKKFQSDDMDILLYNVETKNEILDILNNVIKKIKEEKFFPVLQFEIHGYEDGICTNKGDCLSWNELIPLLTEINILLKNLLMILLGVCKGASIIKYIGTGDRAPFKAIIGSGSDIKAGDIQKGFHAFYDTFFFSMDTYESVKALRDAIGSDQIGIALIEELYDEITNPKRNIEFYNTKVEERVQMMLKENPELKQLDRKYLRQSAQIFIDEIFEQAKKNKDKFLMKDLIDPEMKKKELDLYNKENS